MAKSTTSASGSKSTHVGLVNIGDGFLDVPDAKLTGIAPGASFEVSPDIAERLLADATINVETNTGGTKA